MERETDKFDHITLEKAVTHVLQTCEWPPTVKALTDACRRFEARKTRSSSKPKPGDMIDGVRTYTPQEAHEKLEEWIKKRPDLFRPAEKNVPMATPDERKKSLEDAVTRLWLTGLRKCANLDPDRSVSEVTVQYDLL